MLGENVMKKALFCLAITLAVALPAFAAEKKEITSIRDYYTDLLKKIKDGSLYQRELSLSYPVIPGIGQTSSRIRIYYDMLDRGEGEYDISIVRVENYYQHAGNALYEECVYNSHGTLIFYYGRWGQGDINRPADIAWDREERFYFQAGRLVRVMYGQESRDTPTAADLKKAAARLQHGQHLREKDCGISFPPPLLFTDGVNH
jgi:hypothetical protein